MDQAVLEVRIDELARKRDRLTTKREQIDREIRDLDDDLAALRRVVGRSLLTSEGQSADDTRPVHGEIRSLVSEAVDASSGEFDVNFVRDRLKEIRPGQEFDGSSLSGALRRMADDGEIEVLTAGSGRRATTYRKKEKAA